MVSDRLLCGRPINCRYCEHAYYGLLHMVNEAQDRGFNIVDIAGADCIKTNIFQAIADYDPLFFFGVGHGNNCIYTDDIESAIWECCTTQNLAGRIVYLWSCLTANGLGPDIIDAKGGLSYAGFNISWTWMAENSPTGDPYTDKYAHGFFESGNELILAMLQFKTLSEAGNQSVAKYNEWINYWSGPGSSDPYALECIRWLVYDRDGLVLLGNLNATLSPPVDCAQFVTKGECLAHPGCNWWNDSCHNTRPSCEEINNEVDCLEYGCFWYNGACHSILPIDDTKDFTITVKMPFIWVACQNTAKIYKLDQQGNIIKSFSSPSNYPTGLGIDSDGYIWNGGWIARRIYKLDQQGNIITSFPSPGLYPIGIGIDADGYIWNADWPTKKIYKLDQQGNIIKSFSSPSNYPTGLGIDSDGYIWNADNITKKIYKLDQQGNIILSFPSPGSYPLGIGIDAEGYIWNADNITKKIYKLDQQGNIISSFPNPVAYPMGLAIG